MTENENKINEEIVSEQKSEASAEKESVHTEETAYSSCGYGEYTPPQAAPVKELPPENTVAGIVGAFLFAIAGAVLYFVIYQLGYIASLCGLVTVVCAIKGYSLFSKRDSIKGIVISIIISVVALLLAEYVSLAYVFYDSIKEMYAAGEIDYTITLIEAVRGTINIILEDSEVMAAVIKDVGIMLALSALGAFSSIKNAVAAAKANKQ